MQIKTTQDKKEIKEHGDYQFPVNISVESIQSYEQGMFWWHWHPEIELTCILSGEIQYHVNDAVYHLHAGEGLFGNSNTLHAGFGTEHQDCTYLSITFHPRFLYGYTGSVLQNKYVRAITENENWSSLRLGQEESWQAEILDHMRQIYQLSQDMPADFELQVQILLLQIWQKLYQHYGTLPQARPNNPRTMQRLREMITYLQNHYTQEITLEEIAEYVNVCKSECCRFFKKYMNMTLFEYLLFLRVQNSLPLLRRGESITRTAELTGFSSAAYYGQIFKRYMNCTPREYRKKGLVSEEKHTNPDKNVVR